MSSGKQRIIQLAILFSIFTWSLIDPYELSTWLMEALPVIIVLIILIFTYRKFKLTDFNYWMILIHCIILLIGAHYTYAKVPLFDYLRDSLDLSRNNYDKVGHLAQGFIPALVIREILIRTSPLRPGKWLFFLVISAALAISAFYELIEWWTSLYLGGAADDFLGTQGYVWDTQSDMFFALIGAISSQVLFRNYLDKKINDSQM